MIIGIWEHAVKIMDSTLYGNQDIGGRVRYTDPSLSAHERASDLIGRMTLREKVGQLNQRLYGFRIYKRNGNDIELTAEFCDEVRRFGGIGVLYGLYRADPWADKDEDTGITLELSKKAYNTVQKYVIDHSRLGIPMLLSTECPHGHQALGGGLLPVNLAAGASFDPAIIKEGYEACGRQLQSGHVDIALMSMLDILRDPRWGRCEECYSEDPFLASRMAEAAVSGMQSSGVSCTAKHFCAQGETTGGVNASAARIGERALREIHLPVVKACCDAGVDGIMAAYNEIDGVYCHANKWLINDVLRREMGFGGTVMADGLAIDLLKKITGGDTPKAAALALKAGIDISLWDEAYSRLDEAVLQGLVSEQQLDEAVMRVLELKFSKGLFEHSYMDENMISSKAAGIDNVSLDIARESLVLLKNEDNILPLGDRYKKIAVVGYEASDRYVQLGDYTPPIDESSCMTVSEGMRIYAPSGVSAQYVRGCGFSEEMPKEKEKAIKAAKAADIVVVVIGGSSSRFGGAEFDGNGAAIANEKKREMDCGEGMDSASLRIPAAQEDLLHELSLIGKPIVTVLIAGRPYVIEQEIRESQGIIYSFYPGPWGGRAIAELIFGIISPSGRLPVSIPRDAGQLPVYYNAKSSYEPAGYSDIKGGASYSFGYGLSYTEFFINDISVTKDEKHISVKFTISNTGAMEGCAVPMVFVHRISGETTPRVCELKAFTRVWLEGGEERIVEMSVSKEELFYYGCDMRKISYFDDVELIIKEGENTYKSN